MCPVYLSVCLQVHFVSLTPDDMTLPTNCVKCMRPSPTGYGIRLGLGYVMTEQFQLLLLLHAILYICRKCRDN